ncbi:ATP-binding cassette domain-containing protein [Eggerthella lenta]|uniref:ATP-binding cassette domain-containing protein n=1 Tax=Eggerthella lenta TaxID=84112 RepID=UPI002161F116|nr:ABC transporter ATP-binding protein [Eggerthella lenta]
MREIRVDHVSKSFGKAKALDDVSLSFEHGKIHALLGRNGAGKSTLLGLIANRLVPTSGRILVDGEPAADNARALTKLYCMNDKKMYPENLRLDNLFEEMGRFYEGFDRTDAARHAKAFGLDARKKIGALSTGYRSIYQLVVGLSLDVDYLLLDEPVLGLDANHRELFYKLLLDDYLEKQRTVIIATHLIEEVANLVEQVTIVDRGRVRCWPRRPRSCARAATACRGARRTWPPTARGWRCSTWRSWAA